MSKLVTQSGISNIKMSFNRTLGITYAIFGSLLIGTGQTIQKYAINKLISGGSSVFHHSDFDVRQKGRGLRQDPSRSRIRDPTWLFGILLCYCGEVFGNWFALSYVPAAIVTPLGIVSVLFSAFLSSCFLGEVINFRQRNGYMLIILTVFAILWISPKSDDSLGKTPAEVFENCSNTMFISGFSGIFLVLTVLIFQILVRRQETLLLLVSVCALFGSATVISGKIISVVLRLSFQNPGSTSADKELDSDISSAVSVLVVIAVASIAAQEFFKQEALTRFSISVVQPILFAGFNVATVVSNIVLFKEITTFSGLVAFFLVFGVAMAGMVGGVLMIAKDPHSRLLPISRAD
ncbi:Magnesium transporter NIPA4 [Dinochytrium kinnereticum]|nr:Magnesium transporter NIPA4 [Dinochytrium kinnereticum]